jgi:hypothetical protein
VLPWFSFGNVVADAFATRGTFISVGIAGFRLARRKRRVPCLMLVGIRWWINAMLLFTPLGEAREQYKVFRKSAIAKWRREYSRRSRSAAVASTTWSYPRR